MKLLQPRLDRIPCRNKTYFYTDIFDKKSLFSQIDKIRKTIVENQILLNKDKEIYRMKFFPHRFEK